MRTALVIVSLILGSTAQAVLLEAPADRLNAAVRGKDLSRQTLPNDAPVAAATKVRPAPRTDYAYETVVVGTSAFDYQHSGSYGKMIAIGADGVAHGSYMGGANEDTGRRILAWCVDPDLSMPNPTANVANVKSGYTTYAVTGPNPSNSLAPNTGVVGYHRVSASWFAADFGECSMAFQGLQHLNGATIIWPQIAVDYQDRVHMVCGDASAAGTPNAESVWYDASTSGSAWDGSFNLVSPECNTHGQMVTACKTGPGVAVFYFPNAPASPEVYESTTVGATQWHHDVCYYEANDANNDMHEVLDTGTPINVTQYNSIESTAPFRVGVYAYCDVDAIYDSQETPNLHLAFTTPVSYVDSMLWVENGTSYYSDFCSVVEHSALWHFNTANQQWSHISGWLTGDGEADDLPRYFSGVFRTETDRVQLAHDPETGNLYALWSVFSKHDTRDPGSDSLAMSNAELYMACSADNGATWGQRVNITNTPTPGCVAPNCDNENWASLAEIVDNGYLHLTFMDDDHAGCYIRCTDATGDCSERTVNNYYYMRVPVSAVPPSATPWDAAGHIGLAKHSRTWYWTYPEGHPDTMQMIDKLDIFNECEQTRLLTDLVMYHDPLDVFGDSLSNLWVTWEFMEGDPVEPGPWRYKPVDESDWDGVLDPRRMTLGHVSVGHRGLPLREQAFKLVFDDGTERVYRIIYQGPNGEGSRVALIDIDNLEQYQATTLYHRENSLATRVLPGGLQLQQNVPNPFNPSTSIQFQLDRADQVRLRIHDLGGTLVATLVDGPLSAGSHTVDFDGSALSSGTYFYTLESGGIKETRRMLLVK